MKWGDVVARKSTRPNPFRGYHFAVLDTEEINAFACPGGIIFITRGLIKTCKNEDQLAAVLAHEVGHVANKDGINSISQARWTEVCTAMGKEAVTAVRRRWPASLVSLFEGSIDDVFKTIVVNGYSRQAEEAADAAAVKELTKAGYDPTALVVAPHHHGGQGQGGHQRHLQDPPAHQRAPGQGQGLSLRQAPPQQGREPSAPSGLRRWCRKGVNAGSCKFGAVVGAVKPPPLQFLPVWDCGRKL